MRKNVLVLTLVSILLCFIACVKEYSREASATPSSGSLQAEASGYCLPKNIGGIYKVDTVLDATNYIDVQVNVTETGTYRVYSDTVNGIFFEAKGTFATAGLNTVRLIGNGTPSSEGIHSFTIMYDLTECIVAVPTLSQGGAVDAEFTLATGPVSCLDYNLAGDYIDGIPLTAANTVTIKVNVIAPGNYTVSTDTSNGIFFSGTGTFTNVGEQTITLTGTGIPFATGRTDITIEAGSTSCSFGFDVTAAADFILHCGGGYAWGTYKEGVPLNSTNILEFTVHVITPGPYFFSTREVNGINFSGLRNFTTAGTIETVILPGSGTPTAPGTVDIYIPRPNAADCRKKVTVQPAEPATDLMWKFTSGTNTYQGTTEDAEVTSTAGINNVSISGESTTGGSWSISLTNPGGAITAGTYSGTMATGKFAVFIYNDMGVGWLASPGTGAGVTVVLTAYNTTTHVIEGTFSGNAKDVASGTISPITLGSFKATLP